MSERRPQETEEAYVLHGHAYRESSMLLEVFTRRFGRMSMVARGARRPRSALRGALLAFQRLQLSWYGRGEVRTLTRAEWLGGQKLLAGEALLCGYYLNELLLRLLAREDPHEGLFDCYQRALQGLSAGTESAPVLRAFEKALLKELGYAMPLEREAQGGGGIDPDKTYTYDPERGPIELAGGAAGPQFAGSTLLAIARDDYRDAQTQQQAKLLMRMLINHRLDYQPLRSRRIFKELMEL